LDQQRPVSFRLRNVLLSSVLDCWSSINCPLFWHLAPIYRRYLTRHSLSVKIIISSIYLVLSLAFFCNVAVTVIVGNILIKAHGTLAHPQMFVYILFLSMVDALVLMHLPLVIVDIITNKWAFGRVMCKVYWTLENIGKVLSTFVLTAVSADRYLVVCHPNRFVWMHTVRAAMLMLFGSTTATILLLYPIYVHSDVVIIQLIQNETVAKCVFAWESDNECKFVLYIFSLGYFTPLCLKAYFYTNIILSIRRSSKVIRMNTGRERQIRKLTFRVLTLVVFYFFCWTPYWTITFLICYTEIQFSKWWVVGFYSVYVLAYLNSAINPLLYALLNMELRRQHSFVSQRNSRLGYERTRLFVESNEFHNSHPQTSSQESDHF
uniref:G_PROTEIN_RECEP_F1_2 domain-containing protein n=1 Tax=Soboliphyme baturini TaxID=241478 RepID=A0A183J173_9BILA